MSRTFAGSTIHNAVRNVVLTTLLVAFAATTISCKDLDGRTRVRNGNRLFKDADYAGAVVEYQEALKEIDAPAIHYNLGLTYTKLFKAGDVTPENKAIATKIADEFNLWLTANPSDTATRDLMTQVWLDAADYAKAIAYWDDQLKSAPATSQREIMGKLAGINLKAGNWRESMQWYEKAGEAATETSAKVLSYQSIGNVAWAKLNHKDVSAVDRVEIADRGIGALEHAAELSPNNLKNHGIIASIYNFRSLAHGASWAAALDRAAAADHLRIQHVLADEAKKAQALENGATGSGAPPESTTPPAKAGG